MSADLHDRLHRLADQPAPPQRLDIAQARRSGRRTRQRRRAGAVAGSSVAVAALAAVTVLPWTPAKPAKPAGPAPALQQPALPGTVLAPDASFGRLPAGEHLKRVTVDRQNGVQSFQLDTSQITLTTYPNGPEPGLPYFSGGIQAKRLPAAPVNGHPAYWLAKPGQSNVIHLRWHYDRAGWADLQLNGTAATLDTRDVYRIADSITVGKPSPLRFPVRITGLPKPLIPVRVVLGGAEIYYSFRVAAAPSATAQDQQANSLSISTITDSPSVRQHFRSQAPPNTTVNGHPAWDSRIDPAHSTQNQASHGEVVMVYDDHGQILQVDAGPGALKILAPSGGVAGLVKRITILPKTDWTTTPFS